MFSTSLQEDNKLSSNEAGLRPMPLSSSSEIWFPSFIENKFTSSYPISYEFLDETLRTNENLYPCLSIVGVISMLAILLTVLNGQPQSNSVLQAYDISSRPLNLKTIVTAKTEEAYIAGTLSTTPLRYSKTHKDRSIDFVISVTSSSSEKSNQIREGEDALALKNIPHSLIVAEIQPSYTLILNKFNTIRDHTLLITNDFEEQSTRLSYADLETWYWCIQYADATGMYNSGPNAGASQIHKHLQLVPNESLQRLRMNAYSYLARIEEFFVGKPIRSSPIDELVHLKISNREWLSYPNVGLDNNAIHTLEDFDFKHAIAILKRQVNQTTFVVDTIYASYLHEVYTALLQNTEVACVKRGVYSEKDCLEYNLILTTDWMMVVPRSRQSWDNSGSTVNSFPFMGFLLAKSDEQLADEEKRGPLEILSYVSYPV